MSLIEAKCPKYVICLAFYRGKRGFKNELKPMKMILKALQQKKRHRFKASLLTYKQSAKNKKWSPFPMLCNMAELTIITLE
jgi:hypothetical protein